MKIDRPGAAIIGAVLMVAFRIVGASEALASIDFSTIVLLFSMMLVAANLRLAGFFDGITEWTIARLHPHHLLPTVIFATGLLSAFLVNDIVCLVMTPLVVHMTRRLGLAPVPYVVAVATASNIGSTATITGNPQNMLIGSLSGISYLDFIAHLGPVAIVGLFLSWAVLHWVYLPGSVDRVPVAQVLSAPEFQHERVRKKPVVVLVIVLAGFLVGVPPALMAAIGAALLLITRTVDPRTVYDEVDWGLLVFFVGLFIIVGGAERARLTGTLGRGIDVAPDREVAQIRNGFRFGVAALNQHKDTRDTKTRPVRFSLCPLCPLCSISIADHARRRRETKVLELGTQADGHAPRRRERSSRKQSREIDHVQSV